MPGTLTPAQDYDHVLQIVSGSDGMHDLQFSAEKTNGQSWYRGSCLRVIDGGTFSKSPAYSDWSVMPLWAINASDDFDVNGDVGNFIDNRAGALVALGGYEIFTTEYDTRGTYEPNQLLTYSGVVGKVLSCQSGYNSQTIVGCVSRGITTDVYGQSVLNFWTMFIPAYITEEPG